MWKHGRFLPCNEMPEPGVNERSITGVWNGAALVVRECRVYPTSKDLESSPGGTDEGCEGGTPQTGRRRAPRSGPPERQGSEVDDGERGGGAAWRLPLVRFPASAAPYAGAGPSSPSFLPWKSRQATKAASSSPTSQIPTAPTTRAMLSIWPLNAIPSARKIAT